MGFNLIECRSEVKQMNQTLITDFNPWSLFNLRLTQLGDKTNFDGAVDQGNNKGFAAVVARTSANNFQQMLLEADFSVDFAHPRFSSSRRSRLH